MTTGTRRATRAGVGRSTGTEAGFNQAGFGFDWTTVLTFEDGLMSGIGLAAEHRRRKPGLPIIFISGHSEEHGALLKVDGELLQKPFAPETLLARANQALRPMTDDQPATS